MMGYLFGGFYNKDDHILTGLYWGPLFCAKVQFGIELWVLGVSLVCYSCF